MTTCALRFTKAGSKVFIVDGREVDEWTYRKSVEKEAAEQRRLREPQAGRRFSCTAFIGDRSDYRGERDRKTGRDGRYYGQLAKYPGDPRAVFPTKRAALEAAKRRGMEEDKS